MKQLFLFTIITILFGCYGTAPEKTELEGKPLPSFKLLLEDSLTYIDTKDLPIGKPAVLFFYGSYCPYSRSEMEDIIGEIKKFNDVQFYAFTTGPFVSMKTFSHHYGLDKYKNIISGLDYSGFFQDYFQVTGVPFTAIYGKDGKLKKAFQGKIYTKQIKKALNL
jgi:hypothetical protein